MEILTSITWGQFSVWMASALALWYGGTFFYFRSKKGQQEEMVPAELDPEDEDDEE